MPTLLITCNKHNAAGYKLPQAPQKAVPASLLRLLLSQVLAHLLTLLLGAQVGAQLPKTPSVSCQHFPTCVTVCELQPRGTVNTARTIKR